MANKAMRKLGLGMSMLMTVSQMSGMTVLAADDGWGSADPEETMEVSENGSETFGDFLEDKFDAEADMDETEELSEPLDTDVLVDEMEDMDVLLAESGNCGTSIGDSAFQFCSLLEGIDLPVSLTSIGANAFHNCKALKGSLLIPNNVTNIGAGAFAYCNGLINVEIPSSVTSIGDGAFSCWYYFAGGQAQTQYTGLAMYDDVWFYVVNGKLAQDYTGNVDYDGSTFYVENGMVK